MVKEGHEFNDSLEEKAERFLFQLHWCCEGETNYKVLLFNPPSSNRPWSVFVESIAVLISSSKQKIVESTMDLLSFMIQRGLPDTNLAIAESNLIPQLMLTLHPLSLSFTEEKIHVYLITILSKLLYFFTPVGHRSLDLYDPEYRPVHRDALLTRLLFPLEEYLHHLCSNRYTIPQGDLTDNFMFLLARLLQICPDFQPTMDFVFTLPVLLTITSSLTFFERDRSVDQFLHGLREYLRFWVYANRQARQSEALVYRSVRSEGLEDAIEQQSRTNTREPCRWVIVEQCLSVQASNGANVPYHHNY
ncbi:hypothetical protein BLNAU_20917 [Blattamonas nauphoetae]|uniref:Uncharacterized protein n=1 Tax=Blattamonas nauphoetae TaxID=2049346 RepID=A0ABQ9X1J2_9EUKA|nr:hypothetical protein BLNAU_20917 [Blattamonas nauphoetae]